MGNHKEIASKSASHVDPNETRELIKATALRLFVEQGLHVSTATITKEAGVSAGLLFHYFPTKDDLILELYADSIDGFYNLNNTLLILQETGEGIKEHFRKEVETCWDWCLDNWELFQYMELVNGAALAERVLPLANMRAQEQHEEALGFMQEVRKKIALRNLPDALLLDIMGTNCKMVARYMHAHPEARTSKEFREQAWQHYWNCLVAHADAEWDLTVLPKIS